MTSYENDIMPLVCFVVSASDNLRGRPKNGATVSQLILYKYWWVHTKIGRNQGNFIANVKSQFIWSSFWKMMWRHLTN